jgi:prepilin-type N-terminal cleavage/methylation domain-containing protein
MTKCSLIAGGYSLLELLVVLAIIATLALAGATRIGSRSNSAVRQVLGELEGHLMEDLELAAATGRDVAIASRGDWSVSSPLLLARENGTGLTAATVLADGQSAPSSFRLALASAGGNTFLARDHAHAGVVTGACPGWWATATGPDPENGNTSADLATVQPFSDHAAFSSLLADQTRNLFQGGTSTSLVTISGVTRRFNQSFWIKVVALRGGYPMPGGAMGLLLVQAGGSNIYTFYNPGTAHGTGQWMRL